MRWPSKRAASLGALVAAIALGGALWLRSSEPPNDVTSPIARAQPIDAIPRDAMLLLTADLVRLRAAGLGPGLLDAGREVPGLGDVRTACGFDPMATFAALVLAVPQGGADGDFGLVAAGAGVPAEELLSCTSKVIEARGGRAVVSSVGSFRTVRDVSLSIPGGEIAASSSGLVLLGAGPYLRAMVDAADGQIPAVRGNEAHQRLRATLDEQAAVQATLVLGPGQRSAIADEVERVGASAAPPSIVKVGAVGIGLAFVEDQVAIEVVLRCDDGRGAIEVAGALEQLRQGRAQDPWLRMAGLGGLVDAVTVEVERDAVHARARLPRSDAETLLVRWLGRGATAPPGASATAGDPDPVVSPASGSAPPAASAAPSAPSAPSARAPKSPAPAPRGSGASPRPTDVY